MPPLVTIAIPTYRRPAFLRESLASALRQTVEDIEVFVSDNGADEETAEVVAEFADPRVTYAPLEENIGVQGNATRCLHLGSAPFVHLLHDDDVLVPTSLERKLERFRRDAHLDIVHTAHSIIDGTGRVLTPKVNWSLADGDWELDGDAYLRRSLTEGVFFHPSTALCRRDVLTGEQFEPVGPYDDLGLWLRVALRGARFAYIDQPLTAVRQHVSSASTETGLHVPAADMHDGEVNTQTLAQVREMQFVRKRFLTREGATLPDRRRLWAAARRDARKRLARVIVKEALAGASVERTWRRIGEANQIDPRMKYSIWSVVALVVATGGRPAWLAVSTVAWPFRRYWAH
jgi:hypothetical protein